MADVRPFRALRYSSDVDLSQVICPPFDIISPEEQRRLYERSPHNAVRLELAEGEGDTRYANAAATLDAWRREGTLRADDSPAFYLYRQSFEHAGKSYSRTIIFARLRLEPWEAGVVLPHEQTFGAPKEDRLKLLRAIRLNTSPVYLLYRDSEGRIAQLLSTIRYPLSTPGLTPISDPAAVAQLTDAFEAERLYVADGHHRYETALAYRDEARAAVSRWTGEEPENFALVALTAAADPGLLVLAIHRVTNAATPPEQALDRLRALFDAREVSPDDPLMVRPSYHERPGPSAEGRIATVAGRGFAISLTPRDGEAIDRLLPPERSPEWRRLDYSIANHVVLEHCLGLTPAEMRDYSRLWFTEDAAEAVAQVRAGKAAYAVLMRPVPLPRVLALADAGERMPQKSTFFYPKVPTGLLFNPLEA